MSKSYIVAKTGGYLYMKKHFTVLDSFRGLCACLVALSHFNAYSYLSGYKIVDFGAIYVDFFFVLSGFVIFANYSEKLHEGFGIKNFMFLRIGRLFPLHIAVLLAFIAVDLIQYILPLGGSLYPPFSSPGETPWNIFANFMLIHSMHLTDSLIFNGPSWSISVELFTYAVFALLVVYTPSRFQNIFIGFLGCIAAVLLFQFAGELYAKLDYGFLRCLYGFSCGALIWALYKKTGERIHSARLGKISWSVIEISLIAAVLAYITYFSDGVFSMAAPFIMAAIVYCFIFEKGIISSFLKLKPFVTLGMLSYSIYMIHIFISGKFFELPVRVLEAKNIISFTQDVGAIRLYGFDKISGTAFEIFYLCVVIACAFVSYSLIEKPFRRMSKNFVERRNMKPAVQNSRADYPKITIGMTSYYAQDTIARAIESAFLQTYPNVEILIVDDCSGDSSRDVIQEAIKGKPNVRLLAHEVNTGFAGALNTIISNAKGDFIAIFDDDDVSVPERLMEQYLRITEYEKAYNVSLVLCHAARIQTYENGFQRYEKTVGTEPGVAPNGKAVADRILIGALGGYGSNIVGSCANCARMGRTEVFRQFGGFDSTMRRAEDTDFSIRFAIAGGHFVGIDKPLVRQTMTGGAEKSVDKEEIAEKTVLAKHDGYLRTTGWHDFVHGWLEIRYAHFRHQKLHMLFLMAKLFLKSPVKFSKKLLWSLPAHKTRKSYIAWHSGKFSDTRGAA